MKKNIFFVLFIALLVISSCSYLIVKYLSNNNLNNTFDTIKNNTISIIDILSPEIKTAYLKTDDIAMLYNIEKISKIKNISEVFVISKSLEIVIHNDSSKWTKKYLDQCYKTATNSKSKLIQNIENNMYLYSIPIDDSTTLCVIINLQNIIAENNMLKTKLVAIFIIFTILIIFILNSLLKFFFLRPFNKAKQYLSINANKKTIYSELINMSKQNNIDNINKNIDLKELLNLSVSNILTKTDNIYTILDSEFKIIYCNDKEHILFNNIETNTHILTATTNSNLLQVISKIIDDNINATESNITTSNMNILVSPIKNKSKLLGIVITSEFVGI